MSAIAEVRQTSPQDQFRNTVERMETQYQAALPPHIPVERFMRVVMTAVNGNPKLLSADRRSLMESSLRAAQDGLLPDGRDGALVIFRAKAKDDNGREAWIDKVQWMPMIGGILKKVRNSGDLVTIAAHVVYEHDLFEYVLGDDERIEHKPKMMGERGKPIGVYAVAKTKDGGIYREVMSLDQVEKVRGVSRAKDSGPWKDWWDEMARKTVIRRLSKRLPMSSDLDDLIRRDDELYDFSGRRAEMEHGVIDNRSAFASRIAAQPQTSPQKSAEGFNADFIDGEIGALPGASAEPAPAEVAEMEDIDPDAPAAEHEAAAEREAEHIESTANHDPVLRNLLSECAAKMLEIAGGKGEPQERSEALTSAKDAWKRELPDNLADLKKIVDRAYSVITGKLNMPAAVQMIATEIGLSEAAIRPAAR